MNALDKPYLNNFFILWALFIPITSILIVPTVQGTLPSYILAVISFILIMFLKSRIKKEKYLIDLIAFISVFILVNFIAQFLNGTFDIPSLQGLRLVDETDLTEVFRSSFFTQSLYLLPGILTFIFLKNFYNPKWNKYLVYSGLFFSIYGLYEFFYYLFWGSFGDFLTNRNFGDHDTIALGNQLMTVSGIVFQRINSLALEPSMFAFTLLPIWVYTEKLGTYKKSSIIMLSALILSASTTAIIGLVIFLIFKLRKINKLLLFFVVGTLLIFVLLYWNAFYEIIDKLLLSKLGQNNESGADRFQFFSDSMDFFFSLNIFSMLFGVGFGTIRSTDFFSTLLVNNGLIGLALFTLLFFYPLFKLKNIKRNTGLKLSLFVIFITMMISVPEFSFPTIWLFLGMAYNQLNLEKREGFS